MCFAPQRRALFDISTSKVVRSWWFCAFSLRYVLGATMIVHCFDISTSESGRSWCVLLHLYNTSKYASTTTACTFSTSQLPKVVRPWWCFVAFWVGNVLRARPACNFSSLIWPDGSAPAALASLFNFDPPGPQIIEKTRCFATFLPVRASAPAFFWLFLFSASLFYS